MEDKIIKVLEGTINFLEKDIERDKKQSLIYYEISEIMNEISKHIINLEGENNILKKEIQKVEVIRQRMISKIESGEYPCTIHNDTSSLYAITHRKINC